ncbi:unnamed protein product [Camellia sinensis]
MSSEYDFYGELGFMEKGKEQIELETAPDDKIEKEKSKREKRIDIGSGTKVDDPSDDASVSPGVNFIKFNGENGAESVGRLKDENLVRTKEGCDGVGSKLEELEQSNVGSIDARRGRQLMKRSNLLAKQVISIQSALSLGFVSQLWVDTVSVSVYPHIHLQLLLCTDLGPSWMDPIIAFLKDRTLPEEKKAAHKIRAKLERFWLSSSGALYKKSFTGPYLKCVHPTKLEAFLYEIHEDIWWQPYWGQILGLSSNFSGLLCQKFAHQIHQPTRDLLPLTSPWPFALWGLDIVGPLPAAPGNRKFFIAATDYFTKWVEAEPLATIREKDVKKFVWQNVITRFGIPKALISDNGAQFDGKLFRGFCEELKIEFYNSMPVYPQSNGQAEASNKTILDGLTKRLEKAKGKWAKELPNVLWAYRTTPRQSTGETPFALAYGMEAVIPLEIGMPTIRSESFQPDLNSEAVALELDLAEERRERALIHIAAYQQELSKKYNKWVVLIIEVRPNLLSGELERFFLEDISQVGDVVLIPDESVMENELKMVGLETLVGYNVVTPGRQNIGKVRGYNFSINSGAVESLELDSFGISIIPSRYALLVEDVLEVVSDTVVVHEAAASSIQRLTKGFWDSQKLGKSIDELGDYSDLKRQPVQFDHGWSKRRSFNSQKFRPKTRECADDWELPMDYL